ncbi:MAG TPA: alpha/beta hydrolase [Burkholderiaceae bacterium]|nr:alpha/beta hydrolase [Burkholderiaceae bacterium]
MFAGFETQDVLHEGVRLRVRRAGSGPPLLLLHGHPQTHAMWHRVAPALAQRHSVVLMDLRGRGDSSRPPASADHALYSKRAMASDALAVMRHFGHARFAVLAHDRGARVAHRLALDHPDAVTRLMLLDIAPTLAMYEGTTEDFARSYWHWFFLIQPAPTPERAIESDPAAWVREGMGSRFAGLGPFAPEALAEYERCLALPGSATAVCEDYRASATIDLEHDRADRAAGRHVSQPLRVLWGAQGVVGRCFDVMALWRAAAENVSGQALPCGHYIAEELPVALLDETFTFFGDAP